MYTEPCEGSRQPAVRVTTLPQRSFDEWGYMVGPCGTGICSGCGREVGLIGTLNKSNLNTPGPIAMHKKQVIASES